MLVSPVLHSILLYGRLYFNIVEVFGFFIGYNGEFEIFEKKSIKIGNSKWVLPQILSGMYTFKDLVLVPLSVVLVQRYDVCYFLSYLLVRILHSVRLFQITSATTIS